MSLDQDTILRSVLDQIDAIISYWKQANPQLIEGISEAGEGSSPNLSPTDLEELLTRIAACIDRLSPSNSRYIKSAEDAIGKRTYYDSVGAINTLVGILKALRADYASGYLQPFRELIHADVFADFLDMADYLLEEGYKDPCAVIVGSVLEEHLRKLCQKNSIDIETVKSNRSEPRKANALNDDLASNVVYNKLDQKNVTAWLELRNKAAHGKYGEYTKEQVILMLQGVRDFMARFPA